MSTRWLLLASALLLPSGFAQNVAREGKYWVATTTGTASLERTGALRVTTRAAISIQGNGRGDVATFTLKRRALAPTAEQAHKMLQYVAVTSRRERDVTVLELRMPAGYKVSADLELRVPRTLRETVVESQGSAIRVWDLDGSVRADSGGARIELDRILRDVMVRTGGGEVQIGTIGGKVECLSGGGMIRAQSIGGETTFNTEGGSIDVTEAKGFVHAITGGGNIRIERAARGVTASTGGGLIDVNSASGVVVAEAGSGSIKIKSASNVQCQSGAGAIHLNSVYGGLNASTGMGSIIAEFMAGKPLKDSTLSTMAGDITVYIPSNLPVTIKAINASPGGHRIISDFPEIRPWLDRGNAKSQADGSLNGGGPILRLTASGGTIYLRRQK